MQTWVGSTQRALEKGDGAPQPEVATTGWGTGILWPWTPQWLPVSFTADAPTGGEDPAKAVVGAKLLDAVLGTQFCDAASLAWRCVAGPCPLFAHGCLGVTGTLRRPTARLRQRSSVARFSTGWFERGTQFDTWSRSGNVRGVGVAGVGPWTQAAVAACMCGTELVCGTRGTPGMHARQAVRMRWGACGELRLQGSAQRVRGALCLPRCRCLHHIACSSACNAFSTGDGAAAPAERLRQRARIRTVPGCIAPGHCDLMMRAVCGLSARGAESAVGDAEDPDAPSGWVASCRVLWPRTRSACRRRRGGVCRLDKRVAPFVRGRPSSESDTTTGSTKTKLRELYAWTADCEPPRESAAATDPGQPGVSGKTLQHAQHAQHAERSWEDELRCVLRSCGRRAVVADRAVVIQHGRSRRAMSL